MENTTTQNEEESKLKNESPQNPKIGILAAKTNGSGISSPSNPQSVSLKGKLKTLEEAMKAVNEEINHYKKEVDTLKNEKNVLEHSLEVKTDEVKK